MAALTEILKLCVNPNIGIWTFKSAESRMVLLRPVSSVPKQRASGWSRGTSSMGMESSPRQVAAMRYPFCRSKSIQPLLLSVASSRWRFMCIHLDEPIATSGLTVYSYLFSMTWRLFIPKHSHDRMTALALCGWKISSRTTRTKSVRLSMTSNILSRRSGVTNWRRYSSGTWPQFDCRPLVNRQ